MPVALPPDHPSASFPDYRPVACIHEGEHGDVWKVVDDASGSLYALKYVPAGAEEAIRAGLVHEARVHEPLKHPGVVRFVRLAKSPAGHLGLVTRFVDGPSLAELLDERGPPPLVQALTLFEDVVRAVRSIHSQGVVHRDIKPENVLIHREGDLVPHLADFGLAKRLATDGVGQPEGGMSLYFSTLGTPEYMAPEQAQSPSDVDERADLFSLGCLLYELVTGRVAFDAEDPDEAIAAVASGDYVPPEQRVAIPPPLADDRPPHCTAILRRLDGSHG